MIPSFQTHRTSARVEAATRPSTPSLSRKRFSRESSPVRVQGLSSARALRHNQSPFGSRLAIRASCTPAVSPNYILWWSLNCCTPALARIVWESSSKGLPE
ncbi:hypothetical protein TSUD_153070 [Trifolium subterraneum]|uniref:Uncharacterized protein n=1 Tax=Trifolium subterraneum TaxID=3900 RepID=A0A2Z6NIK9_TRISU|nr:hypothetical protein TSUD_153070 [Trifolium subterraneum]